MPQAYRRTVPLGSLNASFTLLSSLNTRAGRTSRAAVCPMNPAASKFAYPSMFRPRPFMWEWGAMRDEREAAAEGGGGTAL